MSILAQRHMLLLQRRDLSDPMGYSFDETWDSLVMNISWVLEGKESQVSFVETSALCYKAVLRNDGERLHKQISLLLENWVRERILPELRDLASALLRTYEEVAEHSDVCKEQRKFLSGVNTMWTVWSSKADTICGIVMHLENVYIQDQGATPIKSLMMQLFWQNISCSELRDSRQEKLLMGDLINSVIATQSNRDSAQLSHERRIIQDYIVDVESISAWNSQKERGYI